MDCLDTFPLLKASECVLANGKDTSLWRRFKNAIKAWSTYLFTLRTHFDNISGCLQASVSRSSARFSGAGTRASSHGAPEAALAIGPPEAA